MKYKIFNIKDLSVELQFEGRGKGISTEIYLENIIKRINESHKYQWVQFFQLVGTFFVVVLSTEKSAVEEIKDHYNPQVSNIQAVSNIQEQKENVKQQEMKQSENKILKTKLPWKKFQ